MSPCRRPRMASNKTRGGFATTSSSSPFCRGWSWGHYLRLRLRLLLLLGQLCFVTTGSSTSVSQNTLILDELKEGKEWVNGETWHSSVSIGNRHRIATQGSLDLIFVTTVAHQIYFERCAKTPSSPLKNRVILWAFQLSNVHFAVLVVYFLKLLKDVECRDCNKCKLPLSTDQRTIFHRVAKLDWHIS